jgi:hypothetical protein
MAVLAKGLVLGAHGVRDRGELGEGAIGPSSSNSEEPAGSNLS